MIKPRFMGVRRKTEFSPNHIENDLLIISRTADHLQSLGVNVVLVDEAKLTIGAVKEDVIFSMAQGPLGTRILNDISRRRSPLIINSPESVMACYRYNMVKRLPCEGIPFPRSIVLDTGSADAAEVEEMTTRKIWVKRGDVHAVHKEDVAVAYNLNEAMTILREFDNRGIKTAVLQENVHGDTVKFYAVRESKFFHWYYLNGSNQSSFDREELKRLATRSAEILGLWIYGGDAIIEANGAITIIDINDWPSFAPVREEASAVIANLIYEKARELVDV
jgi:glutathione synthase/RimK-type ligase-like ATP-grasp enzyme